jgi:hypothetical protein
MKFNKSGSGKVFMYSSKKRVSQKSGIVRALVPKRKGVLSPFNVPTLSDHQKEVLKKYKLDKGKY